MNTNLDLNKSIKLFNRVLWYDGEVSMEPKQIVNYLLKGGTLNDKIHVTEIDKEVEAFNRLNPEKKLTVKTSLKEPLDTYWNIPDQYKEMDLERFVYSKLLEECEKRELTDVQTQTRIDRVNQEFQLYSKYNITDVLRTLIYVVDQFTNQKVVWGTGRGSSCSSYILYLIKLHDVDSVEYELDINEFFR